MVEHFQKSGHCFDLIIVLKISVTRGASSSGQDLKTNVGRGSELEQLEDALESNASTIEKSIFISCRNMCGFSIIGKNVALLVFYTELKKNLKRLAIRMLVLALKCFQCIWLGKWLRENERRYLKQEGVELGDRLSIKIGLSSSIEICMSSFNF